MHEPMTNYWIILIGIFILGFFGSAVSERLEDKTTAKAYTIFTFLSAIIFSIYWFKI